MKPRALRMGSRRPGVQLRTIQAREAELVERAFGGVGTDVGTEVRAIQDNSGRLDPAM
jgi:hypothetical protein